MSTALDRALEMARANKNNGRTSAPAAPPAPTVTMTPEDREAARKKIEEDRKRREQMLKEAADKKRAEAAQAKEAKAAAKAAKATKDEDSKKIQAAREKAGSLDDVTEAARQLILRDLSTEQVLSLIEHLVVDTRVQRTARAHAAKRVEAGTKVKIIAGDPHLVGKEGLQTSNHAVRCHVVVDGKEHYIYQGETQPLEEAETAAVTEDVPVEPVETEGDNPVVEATTEETPEELSAEEGLDVGQQEEASPPDDADDEVVTPSPEEPTDPMGDDNA